MFNFLKENTINETNKRLVSSSDVSVKSNDVIAFSSECLTKLNHSKGNYIYLATMPGNKIIICSIPEDKAKENSLGRPLKDNNTFSNKNLAVKLKGAKSEWNLDEVVHEEEGNKVYSISLVISGEEVERDLISAVEPESIIGSDFDIDEELES